MFLRKAVKTNEILQKKPVFNKKICKKQTNKIVTEINVLRGKKVYGKKKNKITKTNNKSKTIAMREQSSNK